MAAGAIAQKVGPKYQVTIPKNVREALGLKVGDLVETTVSPEGAVIRPVVLARKTVTLKKQLAESEVAVKAGRVLGPFKTAGAAMKAAKAHARRTHRTVRG
jgi:AbrB family looped-hinge helix DNA binding protein